MAHDSQQLPIDGDGVCMVCKGKPSEEEKLSCKTCGTPWHVQCLPCPLDSMASALHWECPDCSISDVPPPPPQRPSNGHGDSLVAAIRAIEADPSLTEREKAVKRQGLLSGKAATSEPGKDQDKDDNDVLKVLDGSLNCSFCMQLPERPVTTPCGHNFCLKCFEKWVGQGKRTCAKCRHAIPAKMASQPRINSSLVTAIRMAKISRSIASGGPVKVYHFVQNQDRPDKAYTTDRAKKNGKANAASGKIFVTVPPDHFGPIPAENDPDRNQGVLVGECWEDRLECRQWGAHLPHVAGIAGQSDYGSQSVALSGGYVDDEDHGEWFLYTGSGGRDLSGNKRTNKEQSFDQKFDKMNQALRVSCLKGYPVRVVRSHKEKRSSYAPEKGVRYDGVYRIEKCWRKVGIQGFKVCRYLFVRCDNEPAPWTSDEHGDRPRPLPTIPELKKATDITERKGSPSWDFDETDGRWKWMKPPPASRKPVHTGNPENSIVRIRRAQKLSVREKLLKGFSCLICKQVMASPVTTPCGHNFCKSCLEGAFAGKALVRERSRGGRTLRSQKIVLNCPHCPVDIADFLQDPKVNRELMDVIESLKSQVDDDDAFEAGENETEAAECDEAGEKETEAAECDGGEGLVKNDEESKIPLEKPDDVDSTKEAVDACSNDLEAQELRRPIRRKKPDTGVCSTEPTAIRTRKRKKAEQTSDEGDESPSSPLHVESEDD